jgi:uncharacterized protein YbjT (DUF2867 family)
MTQRTPSRVLVAGASGRTGREILRELADRSVGVRAITRSAEKHDALVESGADEVVVGDLLNPDDARNALDGCGAVLFAAGSDIATGLTRPSRVVDGDGVRNLVEAAVDEGVHTFVLQSSIGVGNSRRGMPLWARALVLRWAVREKERAERVLRDSNLDYVIIRPGWLSDEPATDDVVIAEGATNMTGSIPRADVARLMVAALSTPAMANRTFEVVARNAAKDIDRRTVVDIGWEQPSVRNTGVETGVSDAV